MMTAKENTARNISDRFAGELLDTTFGNGVHGGLCSSDKQTWAEGRRGVDEAGRKDGAF
jgi:hypothetical protein